MNQNNGDIEQRMPIQSSTEKKKGYKKKDSHELTFTYTGWWLTIALILVLGLPMFYSEPLHKASFQIIRNLQETLPQWVMTFTKIVSESLSYTELGLVVVFCASMNWRHMAVRYTLALTLLLWSKNILKFLYHANRPFWEDAHITSGEAHCSLDFGKPSGHSSGSGVIATFLCLELIHYMRVNHVNYIWLKGILISLFTVAYIFIMGFSRAFTGAHALDQIIYGWSLGIWMGVFVFCDRERINRWADRMCDPDEFVKQLIYAIITIVIIAGSQIGVYFLSYNLYDGPYEE